MCRFSPEWMTKCNVSCSLRLNAFKHIVQTNGRSGLCDCLWRVKWSLRLSAALQMSQMNLAIKRPQLISNCDCCLQIAYLRSRLWPTKCCSSRPRSGYAIWHSGQQNNVLPSNAVVKRISPGFGRGFFSLGGFFRFFFFVGGVDAALAPLFAVDAVAFDDWFRLLLVLALIIEVELFVVCGWFIWCWMFWVCCGCCWCWCCWWCVWGGCGWFRIFAFVNKLEPSEFKFNPCEAFGCCEASTFCRRQIIYILFSKW